MGLERCWVTSVYRRRIESISCEEYWTSLLLELKMINPIWQSQRTDSSMAFFISPKRRFWKVTCCGRTSFDSQMLDSRTCSPCTLHIRLYAIKTSCPKSNKRIESKK